MKGFIIVCIIFIAFCFGYLRGMKCMGEQRCQYTDKLIYINVKYRPAPICKP
jgi:hypothetical protein